MQSQGKKTHFIDGEMVGRKGSELFKDREQGS